MKIKVFGAVLILISGSAIGWIIASQYIKRVNQLKQLQSGINLFNAEIGYTQTLLPKALQEIADNLDYPISKLFYETAHKLSEKKGKTFTEIWEERLESNFKINSLLKSDIKILREWGQQIGDSGLEEQKNINELTLKKLEEMQKRAQRKAQKRVKLTRYAGVLLSLLVIILFY